ncbi:MAG: type II toxin-antitoxin system VapC family toxin [Candidatus Njordarchaeia archaeon]
MRESLGNRFVLDTSVIIEYIIKRSKYRPKVKRIFDLCDSIEIFVNPITLTETLYVSARIYKTMQVDKPFERALTFLHWVEKRVKIIPIDKEIYVKAGELKKNLKLSIADVYVIATGIRTGAPSIFKKLEKEMVNHEEELRKLGVIFLDEIYTQ